MVFFSFFQQRRVRVKFALNINDLARCFILLARSTNSRVSVLHGKVHQTLIQKLSFLAEDDAANQAKSTGEGLLPPRSSSRRSGGNSDLYMRLGLLLGGQPRASSSSVSELPLLQRPPSSLRPASAQPLVHDSLASLETRTHASTNTSPVSTLTGTSSEAEVAAAQLRSPLKSKGKYIHVYSNFCL